MIGDDGDVDGQLITVVIGTGGDDVHAVDALQLRPFPGGRPDLIFGPKWTISPRVNTILLMAVSSEITAGGASGTR